MCIKETTFEPEKFCLPLEPHIKNPKVHSRHKSNNCIEFPNPTFHHKIPVILPGCCTLLRAKSHQIRTIVKTWVFLILET